MFTEMPSGGQGEVVGGLKRVVELRPASRSPRRPADALGGSPAQRPLEPALPMLNRLMQGIAHTLRDVEALRYAVLNLMPEPDRMPAVRLIKRRDRISARRAWQILGLPRYSEESP